MAVSEALATRSVNCAPQKLSVTQRSLSPELASANKYNDLIPELAGTVSAERLLRF